MLGTLSRNMEIAVKAIKLQQDSETAVQEMDLKIAQNRMQAQQQEQAQQQQIAQQQQQSKQEEPSKTIQELLDNIGV